MKGKIFTVVEAQKTLPLIRAIVRDVMDRYKKMVFNIRFECDVQQLRDYLYYLETSRRLLRISQLDIVQRTKSSDKLSVNMRLSTLVLAQ